MDVLFNYSIFLAFLPGLATVFSPCGLPFIPVILTYYLGDQRSTIGGLLGGASVLAGLLIIVFDLWITPTTVTTVFERIAGGLLVVFRVLTLLNIHTPVFSPSLTSPNSRGYRSLYTLGILYWLASIGCTVIHRRRVLGRHFPRIGRGGVRRIRGNHSSASADHGVLRSRDTGAPGGKDCQV